jgi:hypothetical protein
MPTPPTALPVLGATDELAARQGELLRELGVLDRPADAELGAVLRLAVAVTGAPFAARVVACDAAGRPQLVNKVLQAWREEGHVGEQEPTLDCDEPGGPDQLVLNLFEGDGVTPVR